MKKDYQLSKSKFNELTKELEELKASRKEIAQKIKTARDYGDLSENAEYHAARDEQVAAEMRIEEIEDILNSAEVIEGDQPTDTVTIGNTVELKSDGKKITYTIVSSVEADPLEGKVSVESPIGVALLNKKQGDEVVISLPAGDTVYEIVGIS